MFDQKLGTSASGGGGGPSASARSTFLSSPRPRASNKAVSSAVQSPPSGGGVLGDLLVLSPHATANNNNSPRGQPLPRGAGKNDAANASVQPRNDGRKHLPRGPGDTRKRAWSPNATAAALPTTSPFGKRCVRLNDENRFNAATTITASVEQSSTQIRAGDRSEERRDLRGPEEGDPSGNTQRDDDGVDEREGERAAEVQADDTLVLADQRHTVDVDNPAGVRTEVVVIPNSGLFGADVGSDNGKPSGLALIKKVYAGSQAEAAGLRVGDMPLSDGKRISRSVFVQTVKEGARPFPFEVLRVGVENATSLLGNVVPGEESANEAASLLDNVAPDAEMAEASNTAGASNAEWVQCDRCEKWRKIPDASMLPDQWFCHMNKADPDRADCSAPEEEYDEDTEDTEEMSEEEYEEDTEDTEETSDDAYECELSDADESLVAESGEASDYEETLPTKKKTANGKKAKAAPKEKATKEKTANGKKATEEAKAGAKKKWQKKVPIAQQEYDGRLISGMTKEDIRGVYKDMTSRQLLAAKRTLGLAEVRTEQKADDLKRHIEQFLCDATGYAMENASEGTKARYARQIAKKTGIARVNLKGAEESGGTYKDRFFPLGEQLGLDMEPGRFGIPVAFDDIPFTSMDLIAYKLGISELDLLKKIDQWNFVRDPRSSGRCDKNVPQVFYHPDFDPKNPTARLRKLSDKEKKDVLARFDAPAAVEAGTKTKKKRTNVPIAQREYDGHLISEMTKEDIRKVYENMTTRQLIAAKRALGLATVSTEQKTDDLKRHIRQFLSGGRGKLSRAACRKEPKNPSSLSLAASSLDQNMPSAETAFADTTSLQLQLQSLSKDSYFTSMVCGLTGEAFVECARALSGGDAKKLAGMIVASARFHMDRCDNQMSLTAFLRKYHDALSGAFTGLSNASNLRNSYNNNASSATIPTHPPLPLPPGVEPVNVHPHGAVGQHCERGAEKCVALRNDNVPVFALVSVSLGGGTSWSVNQQYCSTCNDCYEAIGFDPTKTFEGKDAFDTYMATYATRHNFKLTKETGAKVSVGTTKVPRYVAVHCSKQSAHRRGSTCTCPFKVSAVLREKGDGMYEYKLNKIELAHS